MRKIAEVCGVSKTRVGLICADVPVPEKVKAPKGPPHRFKKGHVFTADEIARRIETRRANHPKVDKPISLERVKRTYVPPAWHAEARQLRQTEKIPYRVIAERLGKSETQVNRACQGIVLDVDLHQGFKPGYRKTQDHIQNHRRAILEHHRLRALEAKPKAPPKPRVYVPRLKTKQDRARDRIRHQLNSSQRVAPPITLPTLSILKDASF